MLALIGFYFVIFLVGSLRLSKLLLRGELSKLAGAASAAEVNPVVAYNDRLSCLHLRIYLIARNGTRPHIHDGRLFGSGLFRRSLLGWWSSHRHRDAEGGEKS
ncbi:hypothetical protein CWRG_01749 [Chthonomonas calidirosea]|nr:hypothetical protein CWRG_01749 [Chthonomonas calidirosea]